MFGGKTKKGKIFFKPKNYTVPNSIYLPHNYTFLGLSAVACQNSQNKISGLYCQGICARSNSISEDHRTYSEHYTTLFYGYAI
jgi:hypothetical protein